MVKVTTKSNSRWQAVYYMGATFLALTLIGLTYFANLWVPMIHLQAYLLWTNVLVSPFSMKIWAFLSLVIVGKLLHFLYHRYWQSTSKETWSWDMEKVLWVYCSIACLVPLVPWKVMPIWNKVQLLNFRFIYGDLICFSALALLSIVLIKCFKLKRAGAKWSWQKYLTLDRLAWLFIPVKNDFSRLA